ncbi:MAG: phage integrase SAM-like domain-containing protein [Bacteroidales bacterium]|nr:phage integrase SAM-like domain-containing protein [Bacteroidales bacterium]
MYWDFQKNKPKRNCPNKNQIERIISAKIADCREQVLDLKAENKEFTAKSLIDKINSPIQSKTVGDLFLSQIKLLKMQKRTGYSLSHLEVYNSLMKFNGHLDIYFSNIDITWLKSYEEQ